MTPAEVLLKAAEIVEAAPKLHKGYFVNVRGDCFCAIGAIRKAGFGSPFASGFNHDDAIWDAVNEAQVRLHALVGEPIPKWNDRRARTKAEVVAALRSAAGVTS